MPHGLIPHRLTKEPRREEFEESEQPSASKNAQATGQQKSIGFIDDVDGDGASSSSRSDSSLPSPSDRNESSSGASTSSLERDLTEIERDGAAEASSIGRSDEERRAAPTAAVGVDDDAPSASTSPPPPRPSWPRPRKPKKQYAQLQMPSPEQMAQEETMNNCGVRTVLSGVMGAGLGVVFGIFMGTMDMAGVRVYRSCPSFRGRSGRKRGSEGVFRSFKNGPKKTHPFY